MCLAWQALEAAKAGVQKLEKQGKKWQRPADYYAEMVKSDEHMARVKSQLMHEQTQIAEAQERCAYLHQAPWVNLHVDQTTAASSAYLCMLSQQYSARPTEQEETKVAGVFAWQTRLL